ncbi:MFS transporter [Butyrivibrio sp. MC2013]|uniref:MFS transporter n=1 Tax=Butyrivibrio sp. MC2013 TaxID=1280686 RepID=UPI0003FBD0E3|nr:MFS transporter [Butyrivibrio sp. MC2013]
MEKVSYRDILKLKEYRKLIASNIVNRFGDSVDAIAFTWLVYAVTGSASWSAIIFALNQLPSVLLQPFAGALVERMNKKKIMVTADLIRGIVIAAVAYLYMTSGSVSPWLLAAMTLMISSVEAFSLPAGSALIPMILDKKYYSHGLSLSATISQAMQLVGMACAGIIIGFGGIEAAMFVDAATFFISSIILTSINVNESNDSLVNNGSLGVAAYFDDLKAGFSYVVARRVIMNFCILAMIINAFFVPINSLQSPMAVEIFHQGSGLLSAFGIAFIVGMASGSILTPRLMSRFKVRPLVVFFGIVMGTMYGVITLGSYTRESIVAAYALCMLCTGIMGISASIISQIFTIQFMNCVEAQYIARASSIMNASSSAATPIASAVVSVMAGFLPVAVLFRVSAAVCIIVFVLMGIAKIRLSNEDAGDNTGKMQDVA